jgi:uncharacterized membrane protein YkvA (DUF1232 family)
MGFRKTPLGEFCGCSKMNMILTRLRTKAKQLKYEVSALYLAYRRKDVPFYAKIGIVIAVGYALSPIDLIPDFIPVLGYLDDLILVPLLISLAIKLIPPPMLEACREEAKDLWKHGKPKKWYYGLPIIIIWLLMVILMVKGIGALR